MRLPCGPGERLRTSTFGEFIQADSAFSAWRRTGDAAMLDRLCAVLWRPAPLPWQKPGISGDRRAAFGTDGLDARAAAISRLPLGWRLATAALFAGSVAALAKGFPKLFTKSDGGGGGNAWMKAAHGLAGGLHNYEAVFGAQLSLALFELHEMAEEAERRRRDIEKAGR